MIPVLNLSEILKWIRFCLCFIKMLRMKRVQKEFQDEVELINLLRLMSAFRLDCMNYLDMALKINKLLVRKKKRKLSQPHFLISLLTGYRSSVQHRNVWNNLETNWSHFFWLTGETPDTLSILISRLETKFLNCQTYGPRSYLNLNNKVSYDCMHYIFT